MPSSPCLGSLGERTAQTNGQRSQASGRINLSIEVSDSDLGAIATLLEHCASDETSQGPLRLALAAMLFEDVALAVHRPAVGKATARSTSQ